MQDPYEICRKVRAYRSKNGFPPRASEIGITARELATLVASGVLEALPLVEGGPEIFIALTDVGLALAREDSDCRS
jgi:hypothetical protein